MVIPKKPSPIQSFSVWNKFVHFFRLDEQTDEKKEEYVQFISEFFFTGSISFFLEELPEQHKAKFEAQLDGVNELDELMDLIAVYIIYIPDADLRLNNYLNSKYSKFVKELAKHE